MGRPSNARERLLASALELVWKHSYGTVTIDAICEKAGVRKGSFYHFFESKAALAAAALHECWYSSGKKIWDEIFSSSAAATERVLRLVDFAREYQVTAIKSHGRVIGSPWFSVGSETSCQDEAVREKAREILNCQLRYFETVVRDAQAEGTASHGNVADKAKCLFALIEGSLAQARIHNDVSYLRSLSEAVTAILNERPLPPRGPRLERSPNAPEPALEPHENHLPRLLPEASA